MSERLLTADEGTDEEDVEQEGTARVAVVAVGDERHRDAGVGLVALRVLANEALPPQVDLIEAETTFQALVELEGYAHAVVIIAADSGAAPGTVRVYAPSVLESELVSPVSGTGALSLQDALDLGGLAMPVPELHVVCVQPKEVAPGTGLTPEVGAAVIRVVGEVLRLLADLA